MNWMSRWWHQRDHYDWMIVYLTNQSLLAVTRFMLAVLTPSMAAIPVLHIGPLGVLGQHARLAGPPIGCR